MSTETIDGWEVDREKRVASRGMLYLSGPDAALDQISLHVLSVSDIPRDLGIPVRVARILLGDEPREPCPDCGAWEASAEESREIRGELLAAIAALTGTTLLPCPCGGHLTDDARAQCNAAQSGWTGADTLPWRPAVGGRCFVYVGGDWKILTRVGDAGEAHVFESEQHRLRLAPSFDGVRPLGSLPVPASVRAKAEGGSK